MAEKFYNSIQWGIQKDGLNQIRSNGLNYLERIGCKTNLHYNFSIEEIIKHPKKINEIFSNDCFYIIILEPINNKMSRISEFNINQKEQLYKLILNLNPKNWKKYTVSIIEQIQSNDKSFVGTAISDGKGKLFIEFLRSSTNSMQLTSTGANPKKIDSCYFSDFETISIMPKHIPIELIEKIKESCHFFKGYYEFVYGRSISTDDIFFTFYSDIAEYRNLLNNFDIPNFKEEIQARLIYQYLKSNIHSQNNYRTKNDER